MGTHKNFIFAAGVPQRVNGKVSGSLSGQALQSVDLHTYVVTTDGRAYTAISRIDPRIGTSMLSLYTINSVFGWLFGAPTAPGGKNGYGITGTCNKPKVGLLRKSTRCDADQKQTLICLTIFPLQAATLTGRWWCGSRRVVRA